MVADYNFFCINCQELWGLYEEIIYFLSFLKGQYEDIWTFFLFRAKRAKEKA